MRHPRRWRISLRVVRWFSCNDALSPGFLIWAMVRMACGRLWQRQEVWTGFVVTRCYHVFKVEEQWYEPYSACSLPSNLFLRGNVSFGCGYASPCLPVGFAVLLNSLVDVSFLFLSLVAYVCCFNMAIYLLKQYTRSEDRRPIANEQEAMSITRSAPRHYLQRKRTARAKRCFWWDLTFDVPPIW